LISRLNLRSGSHGNPRTRGQRSGVRLARIGPLTEVIGERDAARNDLGKRAGAVATDPDGMAADYAAWFRRIRNNLPDYPHVGPTSVSLLFDEKARAPSDAQDAVAMKRYQEKYADMERAARAEYQDQYRDRVIGVLSDTRTEAVSEPHRIRDLEAVGILLANRTTGAGDRAQARQDTLIHAGEKLLDAVERHIVSFGGPEEFEKWRRAVLDWAKTQHGQPGSCELVEAFSEEAHGGYLSLFLTRGLNSLHLYDAKAGRGWAVG
jgi:hypothetical protein